VTSGASARANTRFRFLPGGKSIACSRRSSICFCSAWMFTGSLPDTAEPPLDIGGSSMISLPPAPKEQPWPVIRHKILGWLRFLLSVSQLERVLSFTAIERVSLTQEQRDKLRAIFSTAGGPKVDRADFEMVIGTAVPGQSELADPPPEATQLRNDCGYHCRCPIIRCVSPVS
jgi:hypothetical protein